MKKSAFDDRAATWDDNPGRVLLAGKIGSAILEEIPVTAETTAMDFGCGTGLVSLKLAPALKSITAVDGSAGMIDVLERKLKTAGVDNIAALHLDVTRAALPRASFDLIFSAMVLHHIADTAHLLAAFFEALKPGGRVALADLVTEDGSFHGNLPDVHHLGFDPDTLKREMEAAGFSAVTARVIHNIPKNSTEYPVFLMVGKKCVFVG